MIDALSLYPVSVGGPGASEKAMKQRVLKIDCVLLNQHTKQRSESGCTGIQVIAWKFYLKA